MTQRLELANEDFKATITTMFKDLMENMLIMKKKNRESQKIKRTKWKLKLKIAISEMLPGAARA